MSVRENIASNIKTVIDAISSPDIKLVSRQPFNIDELSQTQFPCVLVQSSEETREDSSIGSGDTGTRTATVDFIINGFVQGSNTNIDTLRNALITAIETALETDITRDSNALDTEVIHVETDEGTLFPVGGIVMTIRCIYKYLAGTP